MEALNRAAHVQLSRGIKSSREDAPSNVFHAAEDQQLVEKWVRHLLEKLQLRMFSLLSAYFMAGLVVGFIYWG